MKETQNEDIPVNKNISVNVNDVVLCSISRYDSLRRVTVIEKYLAEVVLVGDHHAFLRRLNENMDLVGGIITVENYNIFEGNITPPHFKKLNAFINVLTVKGKPLNNTNIRQSHQYNL